MSQPADDSKNKKPQQVEELSIRPCIYIVGLVIFVILGLWVVYSAVVVQMQRNRLDTYRFCISAREMNVLPPRNASDYIVPAPFSYGYWLLDYSQREVRWKFVDVIGENITLGSISLRGPLTHASPSVAEVSLAMGISKDKRKHHFAGIVDISSKLATDIVERPYAYYISFEDETGKEIVRDALTKTCYSNL